MVDSKKQPLVAIVGPTASGKSALAMKIAERWGGEIICSDSRTIYKGMDIGTAKPSLDDRARISHYGLDLVEPDQIFSAAQFKSYALQKITDIQHRDKLPLLVGGSGLYIDGVLYDFDFKAQPRHKTDISLAELQASAIRAGIDPGHQSFQNPRHLRGLIDRGGITGSKRALSPNVLIIGMLVDRDILAARIEARVQVMLDGNFEDEVKTLVLQYGTSSQGFSAPGYKAFIEYISGISSREEAIERFKRSDKQLAKRQMTWFKRNSDVQWVRTEEEALEITRAFLSKFGTIAA